MTRTEVVKTENTLLLERLVRWYMERLVQAKYGTNGSMFEIKSVLCEPL